MIREKNYKGVRASCIALILYKTIFASGFAVEPADQSKLRQILEIVMAGETGCGAFSFAEVVFEATGHNILPADSPSAKPHVKQLAGALDAVVRDFNTAKENPLKGRRINEGSAWFENALLEKIRALPGWKADFSPTTDGRQQRSGYPDLRAVAPDGSVFYIDPKLHRADSRESSFRTFYYEPKRGTSKINDDAVHLLAGIAHNGAEGEAFRIVRWDLLDLSKLRVGLKAEFQASNRDIYREESILYSSTQKSTLPQKEGLFRRKNHLKE